MRTIDYLGHSGFIVETDAAILLFDYYRGDLSLLDRKPPEKPLYVFVSHAHADHFNPKIFALAKDNRSVKYILSFDLKGNAAVRKSADVLFADADKAYEVDGLGTVQTLLSTDEGVAFLVTTADGTFFHAGDLNWWDWPGEDPEWLSEQKTVFQREIGILAGKHIDAAFVVLDDRLEENYAEGMVSVGMLPCLRAAHAFLEGSAHRGSIQRAEWSRLFGGNNPEYCTRVTLGDMSMKQVELFYLTHCPYCINARRAIEELTEENPSYKGIQVRWIEESEEVELANSRDYYYVPTVFFDGKKLYEAKPIHSYSMIKKHIRNAFDTVIASQTCFYSER